MNQYDHITMSNDVYEEYCEQQALLAEPFFANCGLLNIEVGFNRCSKDINRNDIKDPHFTWTISTPHDPDSWYSGAMFLYSEDSYYSPEEAFEAGKAAAIDWLKESLLELGAHVVELY